MVSPILKKIQDAADKAGTKIAAKGLREYTVTLRLEVDPGKDALLGTVGAVPANNDLVISPPPEVKNLSVGYVNASAGVFRMGDIAVTKISRNALYEARVNDPATIWVIAGPGNFAGEYSLVSGAPSLKVTHPAWQAVLRRRVQ